MRVGAVPSADGLHLALGSDAPWMGRIVFDHRRHRDHLNLPYEYPRLNGCTQWFTADPEVSYEITRNLGGKAPETKIVGGIAMIDGLDVGNLAMGEELHLQIRAKT